MNVPFFFIIMMIVLSRYLKKRKIPLLEPSKNIYICAIFSADKFDAFLINIEERRIEESEAKSGVKLRKPGEKKEI